MGSNFSTPEETERLRLENEARQRREVEEQLERKKRREMEERLEKYGVLVPPLFGVATGTRPPPLMNAQAGGRSSPSCLRGMEQYQTSYRLLHDHMTPGFWVSGTTSAQASAQACSNSSGTEGSVCAGQKFKNGQVDIRALTSGHTALSGDFLLTQGLMLHGNVNAAGSGSVRYDTVAGSSEKNLQLSSWLQFQSPSAFKTLSDVNVNGIGGFAKTNVAGYTLAVEATAPATTKDPQLSYFFSSDLSGGKGPPLVLCMHKSPGKSAVNLSQILTFDRFVYNPKSELPKIRNTFGWTVEMEKQGSESKPNIKAGVAWQLNRGLGLKLVAKPSDIRGAILLKRWKEPRIACSLIFGLNSQKATFQGIGLELGTGPHPDDQDMYRVTVDGRDHVETVAPETKSTLPEWTAVS